MLLDPTVRSQNEALIAGLSSQDQMARKEASDAVTSYLRLKNREDGFARKILPPQTITAANLDRQVDTPDPVVVIDMEPESAGARSIPFSTGPETINIAGGRYAVFLNRLTTRRYRSDVNRLLTWTMDIRQMLKDFMLKDMQKQEDDNLMKAVYNITDVTGAALAAAYVRRGAVPSMNVGALNRSSFAEARKGLPSCNNRLFASVGLINNITVWDIPKLDRTQIGGDLAEKLFLDGEAPGKIMGLDLIVTIKSELVGNNDLYQFAAPNQTGNFLVLDDITVSTESVNFMIEFFAYECIGATIRNEAAVCKASFTGTLNSTWQDDPAEASSSS